NPSTSCRSMASILRLAGVVFTARPAGFLLTARVVLRGIVVSILQDFQHRYYFPTLLPQLIQLPFKSGLVVNSMRHEILPEFHYLIFPSHRSHPSLALSGRTTWSVVSQPGRSGAGP